MPLLVGGMSGNPVLLAQLNMSILRSSNCHWLHLGLDLVRQYDRPAYEPQQAELAVDYAFVEKCRERKDRDVACGNDL